MYHPMFKLVILISMLVISIPVYSQNKDPEAKDPQNIKLDPVNTDCHKLPETFRNVPEAMEVIENTRFYYDQSIRTTRRSGLMLARFVSCDFKTGYLIIRFDGIDQIYPDINKELWDQFQQTSDIDSFYFDNIQNLTKISGQ